MSFRFARSFQRHQTTWNIILGGIVVGTVFKVVYFSYARQKFQEHHDKVQREGVAHLKETEARAHANYEKRQRHLPELTPEQDEQMRQYLRIVKEHGIEKIRQYQGQTEDCIVGCPHVNRMFPASSAAANRRQQEAQGNHSNSAEQ